MKMTQQKQKRVRRPNPNLVSNAARPKIRLNFDGQFLNGTQFLSPAITVTNFFAGLYPVDCSNTNITGAAIAIQGVNHGITSVSKLYNEYIYRSVTFHWVPFVSPGVADAGSQLYVGYVDNPEEMSALTIATIGTIFDTAKNLRNMRFFNAWERFSYTVPALPTRRKSFDVNLGTATASTDTYDRSMQGMVVFGASSLSAATSLGQWRVTYSLELRKLNLAQTT